MTTRMKRNKKKRVKIMLKSILRLFLALLWNVLELTMYLLVKVIKVAYNVIYWVNTLIGNLFMKLPRALKSVIVYALVLTFILDLTGIIQDKKIITFKKVNAIVLSYVEPRNKETQEDIQSDSCKYDEISCKIYNTAKEIGMNEEQILISIAISKWETGYYTSSAFKEKNNIGGMMCNSGLIKYSTLDDGIKAFLTNLKNNYFDIGLNTLEKIQPKYCPIGAKNDPTGLNKHWLNGTNKMLEELKKY